MLPYVLEAVAPKPIFGIYKHERTHECYDLRAQLGGVRKGEPSAEYLLIQLVHTGGALREWSPACHRERYV